MTNFRNYLVNNLSFFTKFYSYNRYRRNLWILNKSITIEKNSIVLDVGAGSSPHRIKFNHCKYISHDFVQLKKDQLEDGMGYSKIDIVSDILDIPLSDGTIDVILCTEVIEHVKNPILVIEQFARLLKSKGVLLLTAPLASGLHQDPFHFYGGFTKYWYQEFLETNNFDIIEIVPNGSLYLTFMSHGHTMYKKWVKAIYSDNILWWVRFLCFFLSIIMLIPFLIFLPLFAWFLDKLIPESDFTTGYHVMAIRK